MMRFLRPLALAASLLWVAEAAYPAPQPKRIVSLNLCADQYLIALADHDQVSALTHNARNPALSFRAAEASDWPISDGNAEALMVIQPDLVIASRIRRPEIRLFLESRNIPILEIEPAHTFEDIRRQTELIAAAIGHPERGQALIEDMQNRLRNVKAAAPRETLTAAHYQRRGFLSGEATLMSEIMETAGLRNIAGTLGARRTQRISMEVLVASQPDILISSQQTDNERDMGKELLDHPALRSLYAKARWIHVHESLTVCGGPSFPFAVESVARQLNTLRSSTH